MCEAMIPLTANDSPDYEYRGVTFAIRRDPESPWWVVQCLDLPGTLSQGGSPDAAFAMGCDALDGVLDAYAERGEEPDWEPAIARLDGEPILRGATLRRVDGEVSWERVI